MTDCVCDRASDLMSTGILGGIINRLTEFQPALFHTLYLWNSVAIVAPATNIRQAVCVLAKHAPFWCHGVMANLACLARDVPCWCHGVMRHS